MNKSYTYVPYKATGYFSQLVTDYIDQNAHIRPFYTYAPDSEGIKQAIAERKKYPVDRALLVATLTRQYEKLAPNAGTAENIRALLSEDTFTICTAHQPNLLTGYLYFVYKILHAIKLAEELNDLYPQKHFVPVYYMGSEDNDIEELGTFRFMGEKYVWDGDGQPGAVGRMSTKGLKKILDTLFRSFGPPGAACDELISIFTNAYLHHNNVADATQYLVHELFGQYGLIVLNPDDQELKKTFAPVMSDELLHRNSARIVNATIEQLAANYKIQANPRDINLFYLDNGLRERIEQDGNEWRVLNADIRWTKDGMLKEVENNPGRFSPNVILRGLYQETILPDVVFIGGGAEVAYWMQLKALFGHYGVFLPCIYLRQSVMWVSDAASKLREQLNLGVSDLFKPGIELTKEYLVRHTSHELHTGNEEQRIAAIFGELKKKATEVDKSLAAAADAALAKMKRQLSVLETKMLRAEKRKKQTEVLRIEKLKAALFPGNSLQERVDNFSEYYLEYGRDFFDTVKEGIRPMENNFLVIE